MTKRLASLLAAALCLPAISGCGKKPSQAAIDDETDLAALELANDRAQGRGDEPGKPQPEQLNCPLTGFNLPKGSPDIRGISAGASLDQVILYVKCQDRKTPYQIDTKGDIFKEGVPGARQFVRLTDGLPVGDNPEVWSKRQQMRSANQTMDDYKDIHNDYYFVTSGSRGNETIMGVWYVQAFEAGKNPTSADTMKTLIAKYGQPSTQEETAAGANLIWFIDARGQVMSKSHPEFYNCLFFGEKFYDLTVNPVCGLTIRADIRKELANELLVKSISYGFLNQTDMAAYLNRQNQVNQTNDANRKQAEARAAGANGPNL